MKNRKYSREEIVGFINSTFSKVLTIKQYEDLQKTLEQKSDEEMQDIMSKMMYLVDHSKDLKISNSFIAKAIQKIREKSHLTSENSALNVIPMDFLPKRVNDELWATICSCKPYDYCQLLTTEVVSMRGLLKVLI